MRSHPGVAANPIRSVNDEWGDDRMDNLRGGGREVDRTLIIKSAQLQPDPSSQSKLNERAAAEAELRRIGRHVMYIILDCDIFRDRNGEAGNH